MIKNAIIVSLLLLSSLISFGQENNKLDKFFNKKMRRAGIIGMQVGYINDSQEWHQGYGVKNYETQKRVNDSTLFMIASCSKPVTALAILKLYDQGKINLDDNINNYLPFSITNPFYPTDSITFRMLLTHTSSLQDNWEIMDPLYTVETGGDSSIKLSDYIKDYFLPSGKFYCANKNFLNKKPGEYWEYSNMGYALLGLLIENISGSTFSEFMLNEIFIPLKMNNSYWFLKDIPHDNIAHPHKLPEKNTDFTQPKVLKHYGYPDFPDGQLRTTVKDYIQIVKLILNKGLVSNKRFIKEETINLFHTVQFPSVNKYQAIAWNFNEFENGLYYLLMPRLPSHTGGDPGVATVVSYNPKNKTGAIVFLNSPPVTFRGGKILYLDIPRKLLNLAKQK